MQDNDTTNQAAKDPNYENATKHEIIRTDADTVKELVEMKFLKKERKVGLRTQRLFSRKYQVLIDNDTMIYGTENV